MVKDLARLLSPQRRGPLGLADLAQAGADLLELMQRLLRTAHKPHDGARGRLREGSGVGQAGAAGCAGGRTPPGVHDCRSHIPRLLSAQTRRPTPPRWKGM